MMGNEHADNIPDALPGLDLSGQDTAEPPPINVIAAIQPSASSVAADRLKYPLLAKTVARHESFQAERLARFKAASPGSLEAAYWQDQLTRFACLRTALALQTAPPAEQQALSDVFTKLTVELFGAPDPVVARHLLVRELDEVRQLAAKTPGSSDAARRLAQAYEMQLGTAPPAAPQDDGLAGLPEFAADIQDYFRGLFGPALDAVAADSLPEDTLPPAKIAARFRAGLKVLKRADPAWKEWRVVLHQSNGLGVNVARRRVLVGKYRPPLFARDLQAYFAHELLVHALRSVRASGRGDTQSSAGLPGYGRIEEGFGCLAEYAFGHDPLPKMRDRYLDVALALGLGAGPPVARAEMYELVLARLTLRDQANGGDTPSATLRAHAWRHVNRIYRGSLGNDVIGICAKDVSYYSGFLAIVDYIATRRSRTTAEVFDYLLAGKFDPLDPIHAAHLAGYGVVL